MPILLRCRAVIPPPCAAVTRGQHPRASSAPRAWGTLSMNSLHDTEHSWPHGPATAGSSVGGDVCVGHREVKGAARPLRASMASSERSSNNGWGLTAPPSPRRLRRQPRCRERCVAPPPPRRRTAVTSDAAPLSSAGDGRGWARPIFENIKKSASWSLATRPLKICQRAMPHC